MGERTSLFLSESPRVQTTATGISAQLNTLLRYRQLIGTLTSRDLKARYRGSILGFFWSLANPLLLLAVYTLVFTQFFDRPATGVPYPVFLFAGILPWSFFAGSVMESTLSIANNAGLVKKVMFPSEALPIVVVLSHLTHFILALPILLAAIVIASTMGSMELHATLLLVPLLMVVQTIFTIGVALIVASISVLFRDLRDLVANLLQLGFFLTPVLYSLDFVQNDTLRGLLRLNPLTSFVTAYQALMLYGTPPTATDLLLITIWTTVSVVGGFTTFERLRDVLAEAI